ncbi:MAG TPA: hypothetical protein PLV68_01310, partial [Ilumatobacteraceae bacterium]|nr:hypothetical protein [Ilumatobacteraceae bacterium]
MVELPWCGLGGDAFVLVRTADGGTFGFNGSGVAPPLPGANGLAAPLTDTQLYNTIRDGANHGADIGGPGAKANLTDKQI